MIQPVGSLALAALIFSESPSLLQLLGVALVIGAVIFATRSAPDPLTEPVLTSGRDQVPVA
jgi:drug/metabolite transporter (DMT)-like permease